MCVRKFLVESRRSGAKKESVSFPQPPRTAISQIVLPCHTHTQHKHTYTANIRTRRIRSQPPPSKHNTHHRNITTTSSPNLALCRSRYPKQCVCVCVLVHFFCPVSYTFLDPEHRISDPTYWHTHTRKHIFVCENPLLPNPFTRANSSGLIVCVCVCAFVFVLCAWAGPPKKKLHT